MKSRAAWAELRSPISRIAFGGTTGYKWSLAHDGSGVDVVHIVLGCGRRGAEIWNSMATRAC